VLARKIPRPAGVHHRGLLFRTKSGARKPGEQAFAAVAQRIGYPADRIAFFDDLAENVAGSRKVGFLGFHVTSTPMLKKALVEELNIELVS